MPVSLHFLKLFFNLINPCYQVIIHNMEKFDMFIYVKIFSFHDLPDLAGHYLQSIQTILPKRTIHFETFCGDSRQLPQQTLTSAEFVIVHG